MQPLRVDNSRIETVLCDLDGVVWLAHEPIPGSVAAIADIRSGGRRVLFVTNNSVATIAQQEQTLQSVGIPAVADVVTSAMAAAQLVHPGERVLVAGGPGVVEAVESRRAVALLNNGVADPVAVDAVIVGLHRDFDYQRLASATAAVRAGARLIATNGDATFPTPSGQAPGGGAIVAAIETAAETAAEVAGKPHWPMATVISEMLSSAGRPFDPSRVLMVGDRPATDGQFAKQIGCPFILVRSGVTQPGEEVAGEPPIALDLPDLAALAATLGILPGDCPDARRGERH